MKLIKPLLLSVTIAAIGFVSTPAKAEGSFFSQISNPFVFCKLPKPCKACQPFRKIHEQLCKAGQPSAEAKKQYNDAVNNGQQNGNSLSSEDLQNQFTPAISSAYNDTPTQEEIERYIDWLSRKPAPAPDNGITMAQYWSGKGITNYYTDPSIRNTAVAIIQRVNQEIVASVSSGNMPSNPKPWFPQQNAGSTSTSNAPSNPKVGIGLPQKQVLYQQFQ